MNAPENRVLKATRLIKSYKGKKVVKEAEFEEKQGKTKKYPLIEKPFKKEKIKIKNEKSNIKEKSKQKDPAKNSRLENKKQILQKKDKEDLNLDDIAKILGVK